MKQVIILFGPPGAGKGTQAGLLSEKLGFYYFETSKILEREFNSPSQNVFEIDGEKFEVTKEKDLWKKGILCSPPFVSLLTKKRLEKLASDGEDVVIAGSPRTVYEAERIMPLLKELYGEKNIMVFLISISPEETIFRNSNRRICELMRHPILHNEETKGLTLCPLDGSKLVRREGLDDPEVIKVRLKEYKERTMPIFEVIKKEGVKIQEINGEQSVADVYNSILSKINDKN